MAASREFLRKYPYHISALIALVAIVTLIGMMQMYPIETPAGMTYSATPTPTFQCPPSPSPTGTGSPTPIGTATPKASATPVNCDAHTDGTAINTNEYPANGAGYLETLIHIAHKIRIIRDNFDCPTGCEADYDTDSPSCSTTALCSSLPFCWTCRVKYCIYCKKAD